MKEKSFKTYQEFVNSENSLEGILEKIICWGQTAPEDEDDKVVIAETLKKLPKKVRGKVLNEIIFIFTRAEGTVNNVTFQKPVFVKHCLKGAGGYEGYNKFEQSLIILNFVQMKKGEEEDTIAHEVAHFILGHHKIENKSTTKEKEADDLVEKWGFRRAYLEYPP